MAAFKGCMIPPGSRPETRAAGMTFPGKVRIATPDDLSAMMALRLSVRENRLSHPGQVTEADCRPYVARGHMWVWEEDGAILGIAASDCATGWIWALFVRPG